MPVETADDRAIILADFGESVTFMPEVGANATITAIFDNAYEAVDAGGSVEYQMVQPRLTVRTQDIPNIEEGDGFTVRGETYIVRVIMADGTGITELALEAE
jgi:hypothetical protein